MTCAVVVAVLLSFIKRFAPSQWQQLQLLLFLQVAPDNCGYGFCVRGDGPCFIKIVDPDSPAGKAGVKVNICLLILEVVLKSEIILTLVL